MLTRLILLFIFVPICEIFILLEAGREIGVWPTVLLIVLTGIAGAWLARSQGFDIMQKINASLARGEVPAAEIVNGIFILVGGLLLLTPGFLTDLFGFTCLVPFTREPMLRLVTAWLKRNIESGRIQVSRMQ